METQKTPFQKRKLIVLDTDVGTDDAFAFLAAKCLPGVSPDYIIASKGNTTLDGAVRNAITLKRTLGLRAKIVQGLVPQKDENVNEAEKNTFHGNDGLANISAEMAKRAGLTEADLQDYLPFENYFEEVLQCDEILYIVIGPVTNLAASIENEAFRSKLSGVYIMGGGIDEFNCSHDTEFNFSKDPKSVGKIFRSGLRITLFPLDLTNFRRVDREQIEALRKYGSFPDFITFLEFNKEANRVYNRIDAAVLHDIMPMLYLQTPGKFVFTDMQLAIDRYGATRKAENGAAVRVVTGVEETLLAETLTEFFTNKTNLS